MTRPVADVDLVLRLKGEGLTDRAVSSRTGVPVATIRGWRRRGVPGSRRRQKSTCPTCGDPPHRWEDLPQETYAYLLGMYLGDGHLRRWGDGWTLRITLDAGYPEIIAECMRAVELLRGRAPRCRPHHSSLNCVNLDSSWKCWPCLVPQHGRGRKHSRPIVLTEWQQRIIDSAPGAFLRGLIHTDGWRGVNKVRVKGRDYVYPRYQFSNRSDDIRSLFTDACDLLGIESRPWTRFHISVAKRESVAILDRYVGPKR